MAPREALAEVEELFTTEPEYEVPTPEDRYRYKKVGGSSDTKNTADEFE